MPTYLIGYDLNRPKQDYAGLIDKIKSISSTWWHHLDSTWIIVHPGSAEAIRNSLAPYIGGNDELLVIALSGEGAWRGFNDKGSKWLLNNL